MNAAKGSDAGYSQCPGIFQVCFIEPYFQEWIVFEKWLACYFLNDKSLSKIKHETNGSLNSISVKPLVKGTEMNNFMV